MPKKHLIVPCYFYRMRTHLSMSQMSPELQPVQQFSLRETLAGFFFLFLPVYLTIRRQTPHFHYSPSNPQNKKSTIGMMQAVQSRRIRSRELGQNDRLVGLS